MEKLATSLHDVLDPEPPPPTKAFIPLSLKCSILHNVASGLYFLHSLTPYIIHRDLSARNVLLTEGMVAKIADLGMARIIPRVELGTMTKAPGAAIYMPPEALEDKSRYDASIDIFSFGVLALFSLSETFPNPIPATYVNSDGKMVGRTELERRAKYMLPVIVQLKRGHPLIEMVQSCLRNNKKERPVIQQVMGLLEQVRAQVDIAADSHACNLNKLELVQHMDQQQHALDSMERQVKVQKKQIDALVQQLGSATLQEAIASVDLAKCQIFKEDPPIKVDGVLKWPLSISWQRQGDTKHRILSPLVLFNGALYFKSSHSFILRYDITKQLFSKLPHPNMLNFGMTIFNNRLVVVGGLHQKQGNFIQRFIGQRVTTESDLIQIWDNENNEWLQKAYPPLPKPLSSLTAFGYQKYLIVIDEPDESDVYILDSSTGRWTEAQRVPKVAFWLIKPTLVAIGDWLYRIQYSLSTKPVILQVHLQTLISSTNKATSIDIDSLSSSTTSTNDAEISIWNKLPEPPVERPTFFAFQEQLLCFEGPTMYRYDADMQEWIGCGELPVELNHAYCTELPSGKMMFVGRNPHEEAVTKVWIGNIETK